MKKLFGIILSGLMIAGCGKVITYSNDFAAFAVINATPLANPLPGMPTTNMRVFVDNRQLTGSNVVYTGAAAPSYLSVAPGVKKIEVRSSLDLVTNFAISATENFVSNTASTFFVYDTLDNTTGRARLLRLNDTLTVPPAGFIKVRFVPVAVNAPAMDVTLVRTGVTPADSITFFNQTYVGSNPPAGTIQALSAFRTIPIGAYTVRLKAAGTQTLLIAPLALSLTNLTGTGNLTGINTLFVTGTAKAQPLRIGLFRNYP